MNNNKKPSVLGLKRSFGFGDRLGLATPGHLDAIKDKPFYGIFAQQSIRELQRTNRTPSDVMDAAKIAIENENWSNPWGADADHLQTKEDVFLMAKHGYTFFTIDPSQYVNNETDGMTLEELESTYQKSNIKNDFDTNDLLERYLGEAYNIFDAFLVTFDDRATLLRAIIKYGIALAYTKKMYGWICEANKDREFEVELSVDETDSPTTPLEHLFIGLELIRMDVKVISLAPRFIGAFEKGINYKGDIKLFETQYSQHAQIAKFCGPYKLSLHSGSDKFSIYPIIGRISGKHLHVKTAGTSYLEALRVICRTDVKLFKEIIDYCHTRFDEDKATYHISANLEDIPHTIIDKELEKWYLLNESGRQILHVTFGSVLVHGKTGDGNKFKDLIMDNLIKNSEMYREFLRIHLGNHIDLLLSETN